MALQKLKVAFTELRVIKTPLGQLAISWLIEKDIALPDSEINARLMSYHFQNVCFKSI